MIQVEIYNHSSLRVPRAYLQSFLIKVFKQIKKKNLANKLQGAEHLTIAFVSSSESKRLNRQFRNKDYPTDVLSFDSLEPGSLGELILCSQVLVRQAKEHDLSMRDEVCYMVLHGVLHLMGYDHEKTAKQARQMFDLQDEIFEFCIN